MSNTQHNVLCASLGRKWDWDNKSKTLYLFYTSLFETDSQIICDILHKLMFFNPRRILLHAEDHWYEVYSEHLDLFKKVSRETRDEKMEFYRTLSEKCRDDGSDSTLCEKLSIRPFYGSLYSKPILENSLPNKIFAECQVQECKSVSNRAGSWKHNYVLGHLVYSIDDENNLYNVSFQSDDYFWIEKELSTLLRFIYSERMLKNGRLKDIVGYRVKKGLNFLDILTSKHLEDHVKKSLAKHAAYSSIGLSKAYPLIRDDNVQCFFLDDVGRKIYVDHIAFGRLSTNLIFKEKNFESFLTLLKRESGLHLDYAHPSIKASIRFNGVLTRVSIDIPPLILGKGVLDVRKHVVKVLPLKRLLESGYFSSESAAFLLFAVLNRANISIIGEPNSGKTSLLNFLSYFMPSWWRIIHIEDAPETLPLRTIDQHRIVYTVEPFESRGKDYTKTLEIVKVLHRTPSYLILGEIQTKGHVKAMFRAVSAGLRMMHTAHASTSNGFIKRLENVYNISRLLISELDLIIVMRKIELKNRIIRFVNEIVEVGDDSDLSKLFSRETMLGGLSCQSDLNYSKTFEKIERLSCVDEKNLRDEYEEIYMMIRENPYSDNLTIRKTVENIHARMLVKTGGFYRDEG